jgi:hypothetical protein
VIGERNGIGPAVVGALLSLRAAASILSRLLIPPMVRSLGRVRLIAVSAAGSALAMAVLPVPDDARGTALAIRLFGNRVGQVATPAVAGLVAGAAGIAAAFWLLGGLLAVAAATVARQSG